MNEIVTDPELVALCGFYCGSCKSYRKGKCPGCAAKDKDPSWCRVRSCCRQHAYRSCVDCSEVTDLAGCRKVNGLVNRVFGFVFRYSRVKNLEHLREIGYEAYATELARRGKLWVKQ